MAKKLITIITAVALLFAPVTFFSQDNVTTVEAKSYRSGVKSFNKSKTPTTSPFKNQQTNKSTTNNYSKNMKSSSKSGLMKGLLFGGIAGLLFGSMLSQLGGLGSILGLLINVIAIYFVIKLAFKALTYFYLRNKKRDANEWRR